MRQAPLVTGAVRGERFPFNRPAPLIGAGMGRGQDYRRSDHGSDRIAARR